MGLILYDQDEFNKATKSARLSGFQDAEKLLEQILNGARKIAMGGEMNSLGFCRPVSAPADSVWWKLIHRLDAKPAPAKPEDVKK